MNVHNLSSKHVFVLPIVLLLAGTLSAQPADTNSLTSYIAYAQKLFGVPGVAVGIIKDGEVVFEEGFGVRNSKTGDSVNPQTVFGIASCSKAFTSACLAMLVDDTLVRWNDLVVDVLPEFQLYDSCATRLLEIRDLLSHRSGLATFDGDLLWYGSDYSRQEVVQRIRFRPPSYGIRTQFGYQNVMYITAGEVIRHVTGKTWDQAVADRIFDPLEMTMSNTSNKHFEASMNWAFPHIEGEPVEFLNYDNSGPAASINSNVEDLLKWVRFLLDKGTYEEQSLLTKRQYYTLTAPHTLLNAGKAESPNSTHFYAYGLGWFMYDMQGRKVIQHGGGLPGFHSKVAFVPEEGLGFVILANQISGMVEAVYKRILDHYLGRNNTDWAAMYYEAGIKRDSLQKENNRKKELAYRSDTATRLDPASYTGIYEDSMYGTATITMNKNKLYLTLNPSANLFYSQLMPLSEDVFKVQFNDPFLPPGYVSFNYNSDNEAESFTIDLENPDFHFYKLKFMKID